MWEYLLPMVGLNLYNQLTQSQQKPPDWSGPAMIPPDYAPTAEFSDFTNWQNAERNKLLQQIYGGRMVQPGGTSYREPTYSFNVDEQGNELPPLPNNEYSPHDFQFSSKPNDELQARLRQKRREESLPDASLNSELPPSRNSFVSFTGAKPAQQWLEAQRGILNASDKGFEGNLGNYMAERGIAGPEAGTAVQGASTEQSKDYAQLRKEISARAHDIRMQTLGKLFGEVSDAGPQAEQMVNSLAATTQGWNQMAQQRYRDEMAQWQPDAPGWQQMLGSTLGMTLPYLMQGYGGQQAQTQPPPSYVDNTYSTGYRPPNYG